MAQLFKTLFLALISLFFTISLIIFPKQALEASSQGITIWWEVVFPSLLPFFVIAELLIGFGVVQFLGVLLEPIMRPLFRVPGAGGFAWAMGMASGYPSGAKICVQLREREEITQIEAERLVSFTNASSPLFIFGAVAIGFFKNAKLGIFLAICHYVSNALVGICMRFYGRKQEKKEKIQKQRQNYVIRAFKRMHETRTRDTRPVGTILGDAVISSVKTLVMVGGFITLFSVLTEMFKLFKVTYYIAGLLKPIFILLTIPVEMTVPFITGLFEITMGIQEITSETNGTLLAQLVLVSFVLGLNGLSIQAQVASVIAHTDIRFYPYFVARLLHGVFASVLTIFLFKPLYLNRQTESSSVIHQPTDYVSFNIVEYLRDIGPLITLATLFVTIILIFKRLQTKYAK